MITVTNENFEKEVECAEELVVIDLFATWCAPCRMLAPVVESLEKEYPAVKFCKINIDEEPDLAEKFHVSSIPMIAFVKGNVFLDLSIGLVPKEKLAGMIEEYK